MSIPCAVLMCHAPVVVPAVAGARAAQCSRTTRAMQEIAARVCSHRPDVLVIISPHCERHPRRWSVCTDAALSGSFARFGAADSRVRLPGAPGAAARLLAREEHFVQLGHAALDEDHGALVPLYFVQQAGFHGPTLIIAPPARRSHSHEQVGRAIARAAAAAGQRWVVLASGDMSHRLLPGAPCGFDPRAAAFDDGFRASIARGDLRQACTTDVALRELAAEDVVDSVVVAAAAVDYRSDGHRALAYEGPFGVGYLEAVLFDSSEPPWDALLGVARESIARHLRGEASPPSAALPDLLEPWHAPRGVFVTLWRRSGSLRGCIGHISPTQRSLVDEVAACAIAAATRDARFQPVHARELPSLHIELSLLSELERVTDSGMLDPKRYGVVVSCGSARGVLLPNLPGVDTADAQLEIAASKARLPPDKPWKVERFEIRKGAEALPLTTARRGHA